LGEIKENETKWESWIFVSKLNSILRVPSNMIHEEYTVSGKKRKEPYSSN
jgi:hypothetical protein